MADMVFITGGNKGLGFETTRQLARRGATILLGSRDARRGAEAARRLTAELTGAGTPDPVAPAAGAVHAVEIDVISDESTEKAAAWVAAQFGHLDVLVNNAGITGGHVSPVDAGPDDFRLCYETNVFDPVRTTRAFLALLRLSAQPRIVMVSSGMGSLAVTTDPRRLESSLVSLVYPSSKAALDMITTQYAKALAEIRINTVDPGCTATDLNGHSGHQTVEEGAEVIVRLAATGADGPTGGYFDRNGTVPW
ncbi:SDR family NAD(P)-dependent oxidoreductase [Frankia sp. QA3]|uniref:SDR family NAD(P)-dependent oxidoreductase n=1 Tax=Frankia sp. QA3 TaxID=710111 RepID=UPI000269C2CE|nr:SDR family NAD(P)-dependent oxidoreductase [Frankia sp. QA3]EIV91099.1 dehydrogenase of unknown specificity [Frankia sp. QA3]